MINNPEVEQDCTGKSEARFFGQSVSLQNCTLLGNEQFAIHLRREKRRQIIQVKRLNCNTPDSSMQVTPSDFMHVANSGVDFSGSLEGVAKFLDG